MTPRILYVNPNARFDFLPTSPLCEQKCEAIFEHVHYPELDASVYATPV